MPVLNSRMDSKLKAILDLGRVSNLPTVWTNVLAAWLMTGGMAGEYFLRCFPLLLGASLVYMAGTTMNDAVDAKFDREHRPERAIPAGVFSPRQVWILAIIEMGIGAMILVLMAKASILWVTGLLAAIIAYNIVHKKFEGSIYIMGACRLFLYFSAASTTEAGVSFGILIWALSLMAYIAGLSLVARGESTGQGTTNGQIVLLAAPLLAWVFTFITGEPSFPTFLTAGAFIGWIIFAFVELRRSQKQAPQEDDANDDDEPSTPPIPRFVTRLLAGIILIDAMVVSFAEGWLAIIFIAIIPFTLALQKRIAAT